MANEMFLYWGSGSPPCWRAMLTLEEKGLKGYPNKLLTFSKKEHKSEEVLKLNPRGQLPTFRHGDVVVNESMAIVDYLESVFGGQGTKLVPDDPTQRALVLQRKYEVQNLVKNAQEEFVRYLGHTKKEDLDAATLKTKQESFLAELGRWEGYLEKAGGGHIGGKDFSVADVAFYPYLAILVRFGFKLEPRFPRLNAYYNLVTPRPTVQASWPPHWKETPAGDMLADF